MPAETLAASDWNLRPEHPHWPLVWLTVVSQLAVGTSVAAVVGGGAHLRVAAAAAAVAALAGAVGHLGRPVAAWKALRNVRRSWLSREVVTLSLHAAAGALGAAAAGHGRLAAAGLLVGLAATVANWMRLRRVPDRAWRGAVELETATLRAPTLVRWATAAVAIAGGIAGAPAVSVLAVALLSEVVGRWLFFVAVVPLNIPGSFWRGAAGTGR